MVIHGGKDARRSHGFRGPPSDPPPRPRRPRRRRQRDEDRYVESIDPSLTTELKIYLKMACMVSCSLASCSLFLECFACVGTARGGVVVP